LQKSEIASFNAAALDDLSQYEPTKADVTSTCSHMPNAETVESCQCDNDLRPLQSTAFSTDCQHRSDASSSSAAATAAAAAVSSDHTKNVDCCKPAKTLSQLEDELDSLLSL